MSTLARGFGLGTWILLALCGATLLARTRLAGGCGDGSDAETAPVSAIFLEGR